MRDSDARSRTGQRLREALEDEIVSGHLRPGQRLEEASLAERFNVSRTPIREALLQLASSGLVELRPHRGASVSLLGPRELLESFEVMGEIEAACARFAARRMSDAERAHLIATHAACRVARDAANADAYYHANADFHEAIYSGSGNRVLWQEARSMQRRLHSYRRLQLRARGRLGSSFAEHEAILEALLKGEGGRAGELLRDHVVIQGERFMALLAELQAEMPDQRRAGGRG
jgi:DNA-binding GntR family transcriptional regulator